MSFLSSYCFCPLDSLSIESKLELIVCGRRTSKLALEVGLPSARCYLPCLLSSLYFCFCFVFSFLQRQQHWFCSQEGYSSWTPHSDWTHACAGGHSAREHPTTWNRMHWSSCIPASWCCGIVRSWGETCATSSLCCNGLTQHPVAVSQETGRHSALTCSLKK